MQYIILSFGIFRSIYFEDGVDCCEEPGLSSSVAPSVSELLPPSGVSRSVPSFLSRIAYVPN